MQASRGGLGTCCPGNFLDSVLGSLVSHRILERLGITLTSNGKREFVPRDQVPLCLPPTVQYFYA